VEQLMDDQAARRDRAGDRVDQERHVVIDDADAHPAMAELGAERFQPDQRRAGGPAHCAGGDELGRLPAIFLGEAFELAGQRAAAQQMAEAVDQRRGGAFARNRVDGVAFPGSDIVRSHHEAPGSPTSGIGP
jgi:hypothetical protein